MTHSPCRLIYCRIREVLSESNISTALIVQKSAHGTSAVLVEGGWAEPDAMGYKLGVTMAGNQMFKLVAKTPTHKAFVFVKRVLLVLSR